MINDKSKFLFDNLDIAYVITNSNGNIIYHNKKALNFFEITEINLNTNFIINLNNIFLDFNLSKNLLKNIDYEFVSDNEKKYYFDIKVLKTNEILEDDIVYIFTINDITTYKLEIFSNDIYKAIFNNVGATIVLTDTTGKIEMVNPSFTKFTGYTPEEAIGQNPRILKSGYHDEEFFKDMWETISSGQIWRGKLCDRVKSGKIIWEKSIISPIKDKDGKIIKYIAVKENITKEKEEEDELKAFSYADFLTGIYNRRKFMYEAEILIDKARKDNIDVFCLMIDIDNFKNVNDTYGHQFGDKVLVEFSKILKSTLRQKDLIARYGGEEFIALLYNINKDGALEVAERIRKNIFAKEIHNETSCVNISVSIGVSEFSDFYLVSDLIENADQALYTAKKTGKNKVVFFEK